jgi:hypothetical protein
MVSRLIVSHSTLSYFHVSHTLSSICICVLNEYIPVAKTIDKMKRKVFRLARGSKVAKL